MSAWGNNDNAANTPFWAAMQVHLAPTSANATTLFDNVTQDAIITGEAVGLFGVNAAEASADGKGAHTGWVLRTVGSGGRANRVQEEVLVAMNTIVGDSDSTYANAVISIVTQPSDGSAFTGAGNTVTFTVVASAVPANAPLTYAWEYNSGSGWSATTGDAVFTGNTSSTLTANATSNTANSWLVRAIVSSGGATSVTSSNAKITIVAP